MHVVPYPTQFVVSRPRASQGRTSLQARNSWIITIEHSLQAAVASVRSSPDSSAFVQAGWQRCEAAAVHLMSQRSESNPWHLQHPVDQDFHPHQPAPHNRAREGEPVRMSPAAAAMHRPIDAIFQQITSFGGANVADKRAEVREPSPRDQAQSVTIGWTQLLQDLNDSTTAHPMGPGGDSAAPNGPRPDQQVQLQPQPPAAATPHHDTTAPYLFQPRPASPSPRPLARAGPSGEQATARPFAMWRGGAGGGAGTSEEREAAPPPAPTASGRSKRKSRPITRDDEDQDWEIDEADEADLEPEWKEPKGSLTKEPKVNVRHCSIGDAPLVLWH